MLGAASVLVVHARLLVLSVEVLHTLDNLRVRMGSGGSETLSGQTPTTLQSPLQKEKRKKKNEKQKPTTGAAAGVEGH